MLVKELAYTDRFLGDYKPFTVESIVEAINDMLELASSDAEGEAEELHKGVYQDNYFVENLSGKDYVLQHDIVCDYLVLYEIVKEDNNVPN